MRVLLFGIDGSVGTSIAKRLTAEGHQVLAQTRLPRSLWSQIGVEIIPNTDRRGLIRAMAKSDAVIDSEFPYTFPEERVRLAQQRPSVLCKALAGSKRRLIVTSSAKVLGDTGPHPVGEHSRIQPLPGFAWISELEGRVLNTSGVDGIVVRPAWLEHGGKARLFRVKPWVALALLRGRGTYIGPGKNTYSAVHVVDLARLYCIALESSSKAPILHAASENISMKAMAATIHETLKLTGQPASLPLGKARRLAGSSDFMVESHCMSSEIAQKLLGWQPTERTVMKSIELEAYVIKLECENATSGKETTYCHW